MNILESLLNDRVLPNHIDETKWLLDYIKQGKPHGDIIFLSLGETWEHTPNGLVDYLYSAPRHAHGYQLSMYGYPPLRKLLRTYVESQNFLNEETYVNGMYETAVVTTGTRSAMYDYGCWIKENIGSNKDTVLLTFAPCWDYSGIYKELGFSVDYMNLDEERGFLPDLYNLNERIEYYKKEKNVTLLLALNVQHNPTGINWPESIVCKILELAVSNNVAILLDDAYYGVHANSITPTSALRILLSILYKKNIKQYPWLAVRSLGKQYRCNGWGIGLMVASPKLTDSLVNNYQTRRQYNVNGLYQHAMYQWLSSEESQDFLKINNEKISSNRQIFVEKMVNGLGYPRSLFPESNCTNYQLFPIPLKYRGNGSGVNMFLKECFNKTGILYTNAWPQPQALENNQKDFLYARINLGVEEKIIIESIERLKSKKLFYK